jgi:uroporphyrinogen-III decarboxylase
MNIFLESKPDFTACLNRIEAWFNQEIIDRVPIRFHRHNAEYDRMIGKSKHQSLYDRWMDAEYQIQSFIDSINNFRFNGETFPVYMPNLGPNIYAAVHGTDMEFGETTSWCEPIINSKEDISKLKFSRQNKYYQQILKMTNLALEMADNRFWVGYTDLHPGMDCAAAWRGSENLCFDMVMDPEMVKLLLKKSTEHFLDFYDEFDTLLKKNAQPSVTWMNIPVENGRMHIPSNDFSFMISPEMFDEYALPILQEEVKTMSHNVFHVDGKGVANHINSILSVPEVRAIQWVQGMADDYPIMQHIPFIKHVQSKGASIIVDLDKSDLEQFMDTVSPRGIFLWIATENEEEENAILKKLLKWK